MYHLAVGQNQEETEIAIAPTLVYVLTAKTIVNTEQNVRSAMGRGKLLHPNVKVLCDVAVSRYYIYNLIQMFNQGTNAEFCTSPAILQNTCYVPLILR